MRFEFTESFHRDYIGDLNDAERSLLGQVLILFEEGCERYLATDSHSSWPKSLGVRELANTAGIYEFTWSFTSENGKVTWEWIGPPGGGEGRPGIRLRRIGDISQPR